MIQPVRLLLGDTLLAELHRPESAEGELSEADQESTKADTVEVFGDDRTGQSSACDGACFSSCKTNALIPRISFYPHHLRLNFTATGSQRTGTLLSLH